MKACFGVLVAITAFVSTAYGCSCSWTDPQEIYCNSDVVLSGKVNYSADLETKRVYNVEVTKVYKGKYDKDTIKVISPGSPLNSCSVRLTQGTEYILNGILYGDTLVINFCDRLSLYLHDASNNGPVPSIYYQCPS